MLLNNLTSKELLILITVTYLIGFFFLMFIRKYDIYEKEPISKLLLFSFFGGIVSVIVASFIYIFVHPKENLVDAILFVGTVEEFAKLSSFLILYKLIKKDFDEIVDGIIYMAALSLGFSVIENLFYALDSDFPYKILAIRFLTATIGHISFSIYMGIALYVHKKVHKNYIGIVLSFLLATLAHGLYDGVIFQPELNMFFIPVFITLVILSFRLLKIAYAYSKKKNLLSLDTFKRKKSNQVDCCNCGGKEALSYQFKNQNFLVCQTCGHALINKDTFKVLMKYYRPMSSYKNFSKQFLNHKDNYIDPERMIYFHAQKEKINTALPALNLWFNEENQKDLALYHKKFVGRIFYYLGLRFL